MTTLMRSAYCETILFKLAKSFKSSNRFGVSTLVIMVKRGHEINLEYEKKKIIDNMNNFFGYLVVEKIKLTSFDSEKVINFKENNLKNNVTISKYEKKINHL